jgi:hypothetical protein
MGCIGVGGANDLPVACLSVQAFEGRKRGKGGAAHTRTPTTKRRGATSQRGTGLCVRNRDYGVTTSPTGTTREPGRTAGGEATEGAVAPGPEHTHEHTHHTRVHTTPHTFRDAFGHPATARERARTRDTLQAHSKTHQSRRRRRQPAQSPRGAWRARAWGSPSPAS